MDLKLRNKRALVTAASRGLGLASARALGEEGAKVAMTGRSVGILEKEAAEIARVGKTETLPLSMDVNDVSSIKNGVDAVMKKWGGLDILVANTPGPSAGPFMSLSREDWHTAINMTIMPVVDLLHAVVPTMKAAGGGRIVVISTVGVKTVQPSMVLSNATRLAITGIVKTLSVELADQNILVNALCPGPIDTDRMIDLIDATQKEKGIDRAAAEAIWLEEVPLRRMGRAEDFGRMVAVLVSEAASYITGSSIAIDGGKAKGY
jgi:3-oxoacyl-[acyl-carrier protein] reductase